MARDGLRGTPDVLVAQLVAIAEPGTRKQYVAKFPAVLGAGNVPEMGQPDTFVALDQRRLRRPRSAAARWYSRAIGGVCNRDAGQAVKARSWL